MSAASLNEVFEITQEDDGKSFSLRRRAPHKPKLEIRSDSFKKDGTIPDRFTYPRHNPNGENRQPHLRVSNIDLAKKHSGVLIIHDPVDEDDWCHGVILFPGNAEIVEGESTRRLKMRGIIEGINDKNRGTRGEQHNVLPEDDDEAKGWIGPYPGYDETKRPDQQTPHEYTFDLYEIDITTKELLFLAAKLTREKLGETLEGPIEGYHTADLAEIAVLTRDNVLEAIEGHIVRKDTMVHTHTNYGWKNRQAAVSSLGEEGAEGIMTAANNG